MATLVERLNIRTGLGEEYDFAISESYEETFNIRQVVDNTDGFITLANIDNTIGSQSLSDAKSLVVKNNGSVAIEVQLKVTDYYNNSNQDDANSAIDLGPGDATSGRQVSFLLGANEFIFLPNVRWVSYAEDASAANAAPATAGTYLDLEATEYKALAAYTDGAIADGAATTFNVDDNEGSPAAAVGYFRIGDLIRIDDEIMEVTAIAENSGTEAQLTVKRGVHGSTAVSHGDSATISLPFFNARADYDRFSLCQTDASGKYKSFNFFGFGRTNDGVSDGIVPGSIAGKFYQPGYQELGMAGVTNSTDTGLAAGHQYEFDITVDGGSAATIRFTTDASNLKFGGNTGVLAKINTQFASAFKTSGSALFQKSVSVGIFDGDVRFTSGSRLSTSAIALSVTSGTTATDLFGTGRMPDLSTGADDVNAAVGATFPPDTIINSSGKSVPNLGAFFYDDGHGNIRGTGSGTINYDTGAINLRSHPNAEFTITASYNSAHGGGVRTADNTQNVIREISARSCNSKINCSVQLIAFN